jgi:hypothetical protein
VKLALALILLPSVAGAYTPIPVTSTDTANTVLMEMAKELGSQDLRNGGTINANLTISSSVYATGTIQSDGGFIGDGSSLTGLSSGVDVSSYTFVPETVVTDNTFLTGIATVTITVAAVPLQLVVAGSMINNSAQESCWTVFVDGDFPTVLGKKLDENTGLFCRVAAANACFSASATIPLDALSSGSHTFAIVPSTKAGTNIKFLNGTTNCSSGTKVRTIFGVREAH